MPYCHLWPVKLYSIFPHYLMNSTIKKTVIKCTLILSTTFVETYLILRRNEQDMIKNVYWSSCKVFVILVRFYCTLNFLDTFSENTQISNFMKMSSGRQVVPCRQIDMMKLRVTFHNFANAPNN